MNTKSSLLLFFCFMLSLSTYSCKDDEADSGTGTPRSSVPASLANTWMESWSLYNQYNFDPLLYNAETNVWFHGSHDAWSMDPRPGFGLMISKEGEFIWTTVVDAGNGGCQSFTAEYLKGTVVVEDNSITFYPTVRRKKYHSVCEPGNRFDRNESTNSFTLNYSLSEESNYSGQHFDVLTLIKPDQSEIKLSQLK